MGGLLTGLLDLLAAFMREVMFAMLSVSCFARWGFICMSDAIVTRRGCAYIVHRAISLFGRRQRPGIAEVISVSPTPWRQEEVHLTHSLFLNLIMYVLRRNIVQEFGHVASCCSPCQGSKVLRPRRRCSAVMPSSFSGKCPSQASIA